MADDEQDETQIDEETLFQQSSQHHKHYKIVHETECPNYKHSSDTLSLFEFARILGVRATQIENGGKAFIDCTGLHTPIDIARAELMAGKSYMCVKKQIRKKNNVIEIDRWKVEDMLIINQ